LAQNACLILRNLGSFAVARRLLCRGNFSHRVVLCRKLPYPNSGCRSVSVAQAIVGCGDERAAAGLPSSVSEKHDSLDRQIPVAGLACGPVCPDGGCLFYGAADASGDFRGSLRAQAGRRGAVHARMPSPRSRRSIGTDPHAVSGPVRKLLRWPRMLPVDGAVAFRERRSAHDLRSGRSRGNACSGGTLFFP
jgi:hypothetical protein